MKLFLAVILGLVLLTASSLLVGAVLWPVFRLAETYDPALGPNGPIGFLTVALTGPFFGGVFVAYWSFRRFSGLDLHLYRGILIGIVATLSVLSGVVSVLNLRGAGGGVFIAVLTLLQIVGTVLGLSVGAAMASSHVTNGSVYSGGGRG